MTVRDLDPHWREMYEERAAMMEFDAGMSRAEAESAAWLDIQRRMEQTKGGMNGDD